MSLEECLPNSVFLKQKFAVPKEKVSASEIWPKNTRFKQQQKKSRMF